MPAVCSAARSQAMHDAQRDAAFKERRKISDIVRGGRTGTQEMGPEKGLTMGSEPHPKDLVAVVTCNLHRCISRRHWYWGRHQHAAAICALSVFRY
jgi:hypothetical protein